MHASGWLMLTIISVAALLVIAGRRMSVKALVSGRAPVDHRQVYESEIAALGVSWETYLGVIESIRDAYQVDGRLLRRDDPLKKLFDLDSWSLGHGTETLNRLLSDRRGVSALGDKPKTFGELLQMVEPPGRNERSGRHEDPSTMAACAKRETVPTLSSRVRIVHAGVVGCVDLPISSLGRDRLGPDEPLGVRLRRVLLGKEPDR